MKSLGAMHICLIVLALVNMVPVLEVEKSWGILAIAVMAAVLSLAYPRWSGGRRFSRSIIFIFILAAMAFLIYEMFVPQEEATVHVVDLAHFIVFLCCCKFFELRNHRDAGVIAMISFLLIVIGAFVSANLIFAVAVVVDVTFGVGWIIAFHTSREMDAVLARRRVVLEGIDVRPVNMESAQPGRLRYRSIRVTVACALFLLMAATIVFVSLPRTWSFGLFGRVGNFVATTVTGVGDVVQLTDSDVFEDASTVMRVRFQQGGRLITDEDFEPYLRGLTFDRYYDGEWRRRITISSREVRVGTVDAPRPIFASMLERVSEPLIKQEIWLESMHNGLLFSMYPPLGFGSPDMKRIQLDQEDWVLKAARGSPKSVHYVVLSAELPREWLRQLPMRQKLPRDGRSEIPPRVRDLARSFVESSDGSIDPTQHERVAQRIRDYLASGEFEYTLKRGSSDGMTEPVEDFLFRNKRGHCQYFASAMTLMCQAVGIRSRLVSGYHGGEFNQVGSFYQFRKRDAHAWVEAFLPDRGWTLFDPTPPSVGRRGSDTSWLARLQRFADYVRFQWSTSIVSFDADSRASLVNAFQTWFAKLTQSDGQRRSLSATLATLVWGPEVLRLWERLIYWVVLLLCLILAVLALRVLWILSLMIRELFPRPRQRQAKVTRCAEAKFYDRLILLLAHKGHTKDAHATPREFALSLARAHTDLADLPEFTEWFYEVQYGRQPLAEERWDRVKRFLRRLREDPSFGAG